MRQLQEGDDDDEPDSPGETSALTATVRGADARVAYQPQEGDSALSPYAQLRQISSCTLLLTCLLTTGLGVLTGGALSLGTRNRIPASGWRPLQSFVDGSDKMAPPYVVDGSVATHVETGGSSSSKLRPRHSRQRLPASTTSDSTVNSTGIVNGGTNLRTRGFESADAYHFYNPSFAEQRYSTHAEVDMTKVSDEQMPFLRAELANTCTMKYFGVRKGPLLLYHEPMNAVYALESKCASSTVRLTMKGFREVRTPPENATLFTFLRDPIDRAISAFFETTYSCSKKGLGFIETRPQVQGKKINNPITPEMKAGVLERFTDVMRIVEEGGCRNPHLAGLRSRIPNPEFYPIDFIGHVRTLQEDWASLGELQRQRFGNDSFWPDLAHEQRTRKDRDRELLNISLLPAELKQSICKLYWDDYCCFRLPMPNECDIDCSIDPTTTTTTRFKPKGNKNNKDKKGKLWHGVVLSTTTTPERRYNIPAGGNKLGLWRAKSANTCNGARKHSHPQLQHSQAFRVVLGKNDAHTTARVWHSLGHVDRTIDRQVMQAGPVEDTTFAIFVQDPIEHLISGMMQGAFGCDISKSKADWQAGRTHALRMLNELVDALFEHTGGCNGDLAKQVASLPDPMHYPVDFIGHQDSIENDWETLGSLQTGRFGIAWPTLEEEGVTDFHIKTPLNSSSLPAELKRRICVVFREDYCCLLLEIPPECKIVCDGLNLDYALAHEAQVPAGWRKFGSDEPQVDVPSAIDATPQHWSSLPADVQSATGVERAQFFNKCKFKYRAPHYTPLVLYNETLHAAYALQSKCASSTVRFSVPFQKTSLTTPPHGTTHFTFIRDPLERAISAFFETTWQCSKVGLGPGSFQQVFKNKLVLKPATPFMRAALMARFVDVMDLFEKGKCVNPHLVGLRSRLPDPDEYPMDFIGHVDTLQQDWIALSSFQKHRWGVQWPGLAEPARARRHWQTDLLNVSMLPSDLKQRICHIFRDDYCCLMLPIPDGCSVDCSV